jgi:hypothetical protein
MATEARIERITKHEEAERLAKVKVKAAAEVDADERAARKALVDARVAELEALRGEAPG